MSIISSLKTYQGKWNLVNSSKLDDEDKKAISHATTVNSKFGLSVCFFLNGGGYSYMPIANTGKQPNVGDADIFRARID